MPAFKIGENEVAGVPFATLAEGTKEWHQVVVARDKRNGYTNPNEHIVVALDGVPQLVLKIRGDAVVAMTLDEATAYSADAQKIVEAEAAAKAQAKEEAAAAAQKAKEEREAAAAQAKAEKAAAAEAAKAEKEAAAAAKAEADAQAKAEADAAAAAAAEATPVEA